MSATQRSSMQTERARYQGSIPTKEGTGPPDPEGPTIFEHAPKPDTDTDPWEILLKPELDADTERCTAWKDEVSNLLIFAGLFSAVVTAFLIESYKFLQPDPNDAVVGLLFHIATGLNNSSPFPPAVNSASITTPFSQSSSSIRLNVLWFISLVLALTSVLVGTICLQWLREHQSYTGYSSKEKLAIFHMRSEALEVWYVPQIFAGLPVLLQGAVALFLAGLIDFVLPLGRELTIAISVTVGVALLFLAVTTVLTTCQGFLFLFGFYPYSKPPSPCAFKSPQSRVIFSAFAPLLRLLSNIISACHLSISNPSSRFRRYNMLPHLREVLRQHPWAILDRKWLTLRDAYHQCIVDKDPDLYDHQRAWTKTFPLSDITYFLDKKITENPTAKHTDKFLGAAVYCFQDISTSIWTDPLNYDYYPLRYDRRSNYFEQLLRGRSNCSMAEYLLHGGAYQYHQIISFDLSQYIRPTTRYLFHHDQTLFFLVKLLERHKSPTLFRYQIELWTEVISKSHNLASLTPIVDDCASAVPFLLEDNTIKSMCKTFSPYEESLAASDILSVIFRLAVSHRISQDRLKNSLFIHTSIPRILNTLAFECLYYYQEVENGTSKISNQENKRDIGDLYISIFKFVADHLNEERSNSTSESQVDMSGLLFYLASIFIGKLVHNAEYWDATFDKDSSPGPALASLFEALLQYRTWIGSMSPASRRKTDMIKALFERDDFHETFSDTWWDKLIANGRRCGLKGAEQGLTLAEGSAPGDHPNTSSQRANYLENTEGGVPVQSSPSTSPLTIIHPLSDRIPALPTDPQPVSLISTISRSDTGDKENGRHSPSGILATTDHTMDTSDGLDHVDGPPFPTSQQPLPHADTTQAVGSQTAEDVEHQVSSPAQPTASSGNTFVLNMTHDQAAVADPERGGHIAVDVGVQAIPEQIELVIIGSGNGSVQERPTLGDMVSSMPPGS